MIDDCFDFEKKKHFRLRSRSSGGAGFTGFEVVHLASHLAVGASS